MLDRNGFTGWLRRLFRRSPVTFSDVKAPLELPSWATWAAEPHATGAQPHAASRQRSALARPLAAQLAIQARLNVPRSRARNGVCVRTKPKPITSENVKRAPAVRSAHLQARHKTTIRPDTVKASPVAPALATYNATRPLLAA